METRKIQIHVLLGLLFLAVTVAGCGEALVDPTESAVPPSTAFESSILPTESPLSGRVAFTSNREGSYDIYVLDLATQELKLIASSPQRDVDPDWSPSGDRIVYGSSLNEPNELDIFIANVEGGGITELITASGFQVDPVWSPDGRYIAYHGNQSGDFEIYVHDLETGEEVNVTNTPGIDQQADWSPDGERLVFVSARVNRSDVWTMNRDGSDPVQITDRPSSDEWGPRWSPDGESILFISDQGESGRGVFIVPATGGEPVQFSPSHLKPHMAGWAMDGSAIIYSAPTVNGNNLDLWYQPLDSDEPQLIWSGPGDDTYPAWLP